jgi:hypothetical protein
MNSSANDPLSAAQYSNSDSGGTTSDVPDKLGHSSARSLNAIPLAGTQLHATSF